MSFVIEMDSAWWERARRGCGTVLGHFGPVLADFAPFSGPGANWAILSSKVTTNGN